MSRPVMIGATVARALADAERQRIEAMLDAARAPDACGADVHPVAPARGPVVDWAPEAMVDDGKGGWKAEPVGYRGRHALRRLDALDRISGLSPGQVSAGRAYAALTERVAHGGMKGSTASLVSGGGSGGDRDFMDAYIADSERLGRMHRAIGDGIGMPVRRVRPSVRGTKTSIRDRALVDMVCLGDMAIRSVLLRHGWSTDGKNGQALTLALAGILERLRAC